MVARKLKTKQEDKIKSFNYLKKAEDNHTQMLEALANDNFNAAGTLAIQSAISAADAVCIYQLGMRSISQNHLDLCDLIKSIPLSDSRDKSNTLLRIISKKNLIQYESRSMLQREAVDIVKGANRFYQWAASVVTSS